MVGFEQDNINYKSICCEQIPELFLDKLVAKNHFRRFGDIVGFILRPSRLSCTVDYASEDAAERAVMQGAEFNGQKFVINYAEREVAHVQNTEEWVDPDIQSELEAMGGGGASTVRYTPPQSVAAPARQSKYTVEKTSKLPSTAIVRAAKAGGTNTPPPPPPPLRIDANVRNELESLLRQPAFSYEEKYRVLDARDKLIRLTTVRQTDIKKAVSTKGTCPDMCPEKERLMRDFQRQVSNFEYATEEEQTSSSISHRRAIKEYSRSSADQEVPLSHELRPESVLKLTMLYLMHYIMDLCDDPQTSLGDWFHFVWDRTRSIRKDITQQELCSLGTVELVEQCARFHIHCAARLVGEDPSVFDKKINAENLTKCLQSLKYMYHDLRIKNVPCPCEAEFRSYVVLLNLGDANFLWELKQLPDHIQKSKEIKRAIEFYNALQNNNYVRFFDMIRSEETSYLSACILLGYFSRLRLRAMEVIVKAHLWRKNDVLPLRYISRVLGFECEEAAADFFICHGLQCDEHRVYLDRLKQPDMEYSMSRAFELVESKRVVSVGECICGHTLDSAETIDRHQPHNSFDDYGILKSEAWNAEDQLRGEEAERRKQQLKLQQQSQQMKALSVNVMPPPLTRNSVDNGVFKVPRPSPPLPVKTQPQQPTVPNKTALGAIATNGNNKRPLNGSGNSLFQAPKVLPQGPLGKDEETDRSSSPKVSVSSSSTPSASVFKMPVAHLGSGMKPSDGGSLFQQPPKSSNIFGGFSSGPQTQTTSGASIFGQAAKETVSIFQEKQRDQSTPDGGNIFKQFQQSSSRDTEETSHFITTQSAKTAPRLSRKDEQAEQLQRIRELEEQHARKKKQLEDELNKLKQLEDQKKQAAEVERQRKLKLERWQRRSEEETLSVLHNVVMDEIRRIADKERQTYQLLAQRTEQILRNLVDDVVQAKVEELANEEYAIMCHDQLLLNRYFERWISYVRKRNEQKQMMEASPIWVTTDTRTQQIERILHPRQQENLQMIKRYRHGEPCNFSLLLWENPLSRGHTKRIDLFELLQKHTPNLRTLGEGALLSSCKYLKLVFSLPSDREELPGFESLCNRWLKKYVKSLNTSEKCQSAYVCGVSSNIGLCVRKLSGIVATNELGELATNRESDNADGILFFMTGCNLQNTRKRLHHLLKMSHIGKSIPIAFLAYDCRYSVEQLNELLEVDLLVEDLKISSYCFFGLAESKSRFSFEAEFARCMRFLARQTISDDVESANRLEMQSVNSWLSSSIGEEMWQRWEESALRNPAFSKVCSIPQHILAVYDEALQRLEDIIDEDFSECTEFPLELREFVAPQMGNIPMGLEHFPEDWKNPQRSRQLVALLNKLKLPKMGEISELPQNLDDYEIWLLNYSGLLIPEDDTKSTQASYHAINALIQQLRRTDLQDLPIEQRFQLVNFLPVVKEFVFAHVNNILEKCAIHLPAEVIYRRRCLVDYQSQPWWLNFKAVREVTVDYSVKPSEPVEDNTDSASVSYEEITRILQHAEEVSRIADESLLMISQQIKPKLLSLSCENLTKDLDEKFQTFAETQQRAEYHYGLVHQMPENLEDSEASEEDGAIANTVEYSSTDRREFSALNHKRKHEDSFTEVDSVIEQAFKLIERVESNEDLRYRQKLKIASIDRML